MKKTKRLISCILALSLIFSTLVIVKTSASTKGKEYSKKYLQNGSFDDQKFDDFKGYYYQPNRSDVDYWDTTATDGRLEFFKGNSKQYHFNRTATNYPDKPEYLQVADGEIAAELNAEQESTIYQRINTISGSTYTWGLYHRGRDLTDRMVLFIGPEQYDASKKPVNPSKPDANGHDQFVRITHWLKTQYGVDYPEIGCSQKYIVYSKPFAEKGTFKDEDPDNEDNNISLVETNEINQEWSVWVISSPYCNTSEKNTKNGWSEYGTRTYEEGKEDFNDIIKGAGSKIGYDCTYTVPNGQTNTLFAFCSLSSGSLSQPNRKTYGNLLDGIKFDLYQPVSSSITPGGVGGAENGNIVITSNIIAGNSMHSVLRDGEECTIYTKKYNDEKVQDCKFVGAYVTTNNDDGTSTTKFVTPYNGNISELTDAQLEEQSKKNFINKQTEVEGKTWDYYFKIKINTPVSIHLIYTKAPFVLYDSNGGKDYYFSPDNTKGGNLVGFANEFQRIFDKIVDGKETYVDTSAYYSNYTTKDKDDGSTEIIPGFYKSHAALPNDNWYKNSDGTSPNKFCGWSLSNSDGKQVVIPGEHKVKYDPTEVENSGMVSFTDLNDQPLKDSEGNEIGNLLLDASNGITLSAIWKFYHRAQAQTYSTNTGEFVNSAEGGYVKVTRMPDGWVSDDVAEYTQTVNGEERIEYVDAAGNDGDQIMFKATPDYQNDYTFAGWYCREEKADGTSEYVLRSVSSSIAVTIEEGKFNTYYARFQKKAVPVLFMYSQTGGVNEDDYDFYDNDDNHQYGKYQQQVPLGATATKPTGDSQSVTTWYTSLDRNADSVFDFSTPIRTETILYAGPPYSFNYFNSFTLREPWSVDTYGTIKIGKKYIDLKTDPGISDYNVYMLKGSLGDTIPTAEEMRRDATKVGKNTNDSANLIFNTVTNTGQRFNRAGVTFNDFYLFNMKTPVWVMFDFTYNGYTYTSSVKDRSLYNNIKTYMEEATNGYYTTFPPKTQDQLRQAQTALLNRIQGMYDALAVRGITESTKYESAVSVSGLTYDKATDRRYTFTSATAIRNIEPWGLKYSFTVDGHSFSEFSDYGAVVLTDKEGSFSESEISVNELLNNKNSVMYSALSKNIYSGNGDAREIYYINNMLATDFDKNTYVAFFVKDSQGKCYFSDIVKNSYNSVAAADNSDDKIISESIINYSNALINYTNLVDEANNNKNK